MELKDIEEGEETTFEFGYDCKPVVVEFQNICYRSPLRRDATDRQYILKNISGTFHPSRLSAIVGSIGSSKTTLLNLLSGLKSNHAATNIKLNGRTLNTNSIRNKSAYVTHDFPLHNHLTTFETLKFAADFKLSSNMSSIAKLKMINNIMEGLNLAECRNLHVSKLNDSQRNVLALGVGLMTKSSVLYFDLAARYDESTLMVVLNYLKNMTQRGHTIVCALDQPSTKILQHFDDVMLLADGQSIYCGPSDKMDEVFEKVGLVRPPCLGHAEFILDIASCSAVNLKNHQVLLKGNTLKNLSANGNNFVSEPSNYKTWRYPTGYWSQFRSLTQRNLLVMIRDSMFVQMRLISNIIVGVFLGLVFFDIGNNAGRIYTSTSLLFFMIMFVFFSNAIPNLLSFPMDIEVFLQEHKQRYYSVEIFFIARIFTELIQHLIGSTVFLVISFFMVNHPISCFIYIWIIFMMNAIVSLGTSSVIVTLVQNSTMRMYTLLFTSIPIMIFSGMFIKFNEISPYFKPAIYISHFRYSFEGSMQSIYGFNRPSLICSDPFCYFKLPDRFLDAVFMGGDLYWYDVGGLGIWIVVLFLVFYVVLKYRVGHRK